MNPPANAIEAQATLHHAYFLGLQLMVASQVSPKTTGDWIFRLFRQQHEQYFLQSFEKLGLSELPDAVACARYHVLSNTVGGVPVEYAEESASKAWVRFRYPRWMFSGPTICGVPVEASRGFLRGWYAQNGVTLNNPRLGFVCVSEDMTGEFGFCGYFKAFDRELADSERLQFARGEYPPPFVAADQPTLPSAQWDQERLAKANRNYAMAYIRNGISALIAVLGSEQARALGGRAARLIGLQYFAELAQMLALPDGDYADSANFLYIMLLGLDEQLDVEIDDPLRQATVTQHSPRIVQGLDGEEREILLACWIELWLGTLHAHRRFKNVAVAAHENGLRWTISDK